jgi:hypothetical protein
MRETAREQIAIGAVRRIWRFEHFETDRPSGVDDSPAITRRDTVEP